MSRRRLAAVASVLDDTHAALVRGVWKELNDNFGVAGVEISPLPHFTYAAARDFDVDALTDIVGRLAEQSRRLKVRAAGVGVFTGEKSMVHVPLVRTPELTRFQLAAWSASMAVADKGIEHYHPSRWLPHVTLAVGITADVTADVIRLLTLRSFDWTFEIDNVCVIAGAGHKPQELVARYDLGPPARNF